MMRTRTPHICGFTIVEVLVSISIVSLLLAMLLPSLLGIRKQSEQTVCAAQMSSHWKAVTMYTDAYDGLFPTVDWTQYESPGYPVNQQHDPWFHPSGYGYVPSNWATVMLDTYDDDPLNQSLICPGDTRTQAINTELRSSTMPIGPSVGSGNSYTLSYSLFIDHKALTKVPPEFGEQHFVTHRLHSVRYPSQKGTMKEQSPVHDATQEQADIGVAMLPARYNIAAADGHVKYRSTDTFRPGVVHDDRGDPLIRKSFGPMKAIHFTIDGVRGRDW